MVNAYTAPAGLRSSGKIASLRIEACDAAEICADLIDVAVTDSRGRFEMQLDAEYLAELLPQKVPEIAFRIFENGKRVAQDAADYLPGRDSGDTVADPASDFRRSQHREECAGAMSQGAVTSIKSDSNQGG